MVRMAYQESPDAGVPLRQPDGRRAQEADAVARSDLLAAAEVDVPAAAVIGDGDGVGRRRDGGQRPPAKGTDRAISATMRRVTRGLSRHLAWILGRVRTARAEPCSIRRSRLRRRPPESAAANTVSRKPAASWPPLATRYSTSMTAPDRPSPWAAPCCRCTAPGESPEPRRGRTKAGRGARPDDDEGQDGQHPGRRP